VRYAFQGLWYNRVMETEPGAPSESPLSQVDAVLAGFAALTFNDVTTARGLKERALVLIRYLSDGDTRLYMSIAKGAQFDRAPLAMTQAEMNHAKARWDRCTSIAIDALTALREGIALRWHARVGATTAQPIGFEELLHPEIIQHAMKHFRDGDYRNAVSDGMLVLTERIRARTGLMSDGDTLVVDAFKPASPRLAFTRRRTPSEVDEHRGFFLIMQGAFAGVRNPKAHVLSTDLDGPKAAQYLVFISLLLRRVDEAMPVPASP
jgi:uncharacterized protein (TIGR02391 family)